MNIYGKMYKVPRTLNMYVSYEFGPYEVVPGGKPKYIPLDVLIKRLASYEKNKKLISETQEEIEIPVIDKFSELPAEIRDTYQAKMFHYEANIEALRLYGVYYDDLENIRQKEKVMKAATELAYKREGAELVEEFFDLVENGRV